MFSIHARSSSVAPRLAANARKSQRSLTPSPPWIWPPTRRSVPGSASSLTCVFVAPGKYRARDTPTPLASTYGMPIAWASVSPTEKPPIVYSPATSPHGTHTGSYLRSSPAAFAPAVRPCAYACEPVRPRIGIIGTTGGLIVDDHMRTPRDGDQSAGRAD